MNVDLVVDVVRKSAQTDIVKEKQIEKLISACSEWWLLLRWAYYEQGRKGAVEKLSICSFLFEILSSLCPSVYYQCQVECGAADSRLQHIVQWLWEVHAITSPCSTIITTCGINRSSARNKPATIGSKLLPTHSNIAVLLFCINP